MEIRVSYWFTSASVLNCRQRALCSDGTGALLIHCYNLCATVPMVRLGKLNTVVSG